MSLTAKSSGGDFELAPEGTFPARCYRLIDKGTSYDERWQKTSHKVLVSWELLGEERMSNGEPFTVHRNYTVSLHEKSALRRDLTAWRGKAFTQKELEGFALTNVVGAPCLLSVVHNVDGDRTYSNISSITALPKGMQCPKPINAPVIFDVDDPDWDVFDSLSEGIQKAIVASEEYQQKWSDKAHAAKAEPGVAATAEMGGVAEKTVAELADGFEPDSDIPF